MHPTHSVHAAMMHMLTKVEVYIHCMYILPEQHQAIRLSSIAATDGSDGFF